jgi:hypothetical protein
MSTRLAATMRAGFVAALLGGVPSTVDALVRGDDPLESTRAIGTIVTSSNKDSTLLLAAVPVHLGISMFWAAVIARLLPARRRLLLGALTGAGIAVFDLRVLGRSFPRIRALPLAPQIADHIAFAMIVAALTNPP